MSVDWNLAPRPVNVLQSLQVLGAAQENARLEQQREAEASQAQRLAVLNRDIGAAIDPMTGNVNAQRVISAYQSAGDGMGALKFAQDRQTDFTKRRKAQAEPIAQTAWKVLKLPPEQQAAAFYGYVDQFAQDNPAAAQFRDVPPDKIPQFLEAMLAEVGWLDDFQRDTEQKPFNIGPGEGRYQMGPNGEVQTIIAPNTGDGGFGEPLGVVTKVIDGKTYYQTPDGKVYDEPPGGGRASAPGTFQPSGYSG